MCARKALLVLVAVGFFAAARAPAAEPDLVPLPLAPVGQKAPRPPPRWLKKGRLGTLSLKSATAGAVVQIDGLEVGAVPLGPVQLPPGKHEVRLSKPGFREQHQRFAIKAGQKATVALSLKAIKGLPLEETVVVRAGEQSTLFVAGPAPLPELPPPPPLPLPELKPAAKESPKLAAKAPADLPPPLLVAAVLPPRTAVAVTRLAVPAAATQSVASSDDRPLTRRWYFWGGAAAVATVVAFGVVYALPARYVERRDPTQACGGPCGIVINK